ncbi:E3 ubiquitin-protein ligase TRIM8-like [Anomaloglossus baeobatrachus]
MASAELRAELDCAICLSLYTDPVSLRCGHFFCRSCIVSALDTQEAAGVYSCPDCRAEYPERPALEKNRKLRNIVERFSSTQPEMEETRTFCTFCTKSPVPAVKSCLQCETSMCEEHLTAHNKSVNHNLTEPMVSFINGKCSTHKEILKYYCPRDNSCICVSCWVAGDHKGHDVELLDVASEKKKQELRPDIERLKSKTGEAEKRVQNLKDHEAEQEKKSSGLGDRVTGLFTDLRKKLDSLEERIQGEISRQKGQVSLSISDLVGQVELHMKEVSKKINSLEELCNISDPLSFLRDVNTVPRAYETYVPWTPAEQMVFLQNAPDPTRNPVSFSRYLAQIQVSYRSTWLDMEGLCRVKMSPEMYAKLTAHLAAHVPDDTHTVASGQDFMITLNLFCAQEQRTKGTMGPVHQGPVENVSSFYYRLMQSFADEGLDLQAGAIRCLMVRFFMDGIYAPLADKLKACCPEWRNMEDIDLLVNKASGLETDARDKRTKKVVIAAVDGQPEVTRRKGPTCYYCGNRGHVIRDCRKKKREGQNQPESQEEKTA